MEDPRDAARDPRRRPRHMILALETSCDDTCAAVVTHDGEIRSNVVSSQGVHARFGGVVPEWASRHHLEQVNAIVDEALDGLAGRDRPRGRHAGAGAGRRAADRRGHRERARRLAASAVGAGESPAGAHRRELSGRLRATVPVPGGVRRAHVPGAGARARRLRDARPDARRRRRRGVRQGRAAARARLPGRAGAVEAGAGGRSDGVQVPDRVQDGRARFLLRGPEDRAALQGPRPRRRAMRCGRTSPPPTSTRSSRR